MLEAHEWNTETSVPVSRNEKNDSVPGYAGWQVHGMSTCHNFMGQCRIPSRGGSAIANKSAIALKILHLPDASESAE